MLFITSPDGPPGQWDFTLSGVYAQALVPGVFDPPRRAASARTISRVELVRRTAGASGTTRIDVKKNGTSVFTSAVQMPQVSAGADYAVAIVSEFEAGAAKLTTGDIIEVSIEEVETYLAGPDEGPEGLTVSIYFSP